jgi:hypothetical protein
MAKQQENTKKKWLLLLVRHRYIALGISILLFSAVGATLYAARAFPRGYPLQIGQLQATTKQDAIHTLQDAFQLYQQGTADSLRQALKKFEQARSLFQSVANKEGEATAIRSCPIEAWDC